jgi:hypothetical protein
LSIDVLADILGFLSGAKEIMQKRRVCKKWKEAVKKTIVPFVQTKDVHTARASSGYFIVGNMKEYNAMNVMTRAMPNLQQIRIGDAYNLRDENKYNDGEDPDEEEAARTADHTSHDITIISNFGKLRILELYRADLNGRYPFIFNFPLLQKLSLNYCYRLKWDLEMLAGLPSLKELDCYSNDATTGNINSLRVLKDKLEKVRIGCCKNVEGNFMDLADFTFLKKLELFDTAVTGDIRDIGRNDFLSLELLWLPKGVYGGDENEFQRIADGPDVVRAVYLLKKQRPALAIPETWCAILSEVSPDWYERADDDEEAPPFYIHFVKAGSRIGYRWETRYHGGYPCEVNWLDPEPDSKSSGYGKYIEKLQSINSEVDFYKGFHHPPTEEEYNRLCEEYAAERWEDYGRGII